VIFLPPYEAIVKKFVEGYKVLMGITPELEFVDLLADEEQELAFITAFRTLIRLHNVLKTFTEFTWDDLPMTEQEFADYTSKYLDLREKAKRNSSKEKASILEDIDFELELIHRDEINVAYILKLLARLKNSEKQDQAAEKKKIMAMLSGEVDLRSKRELIEKFIEENLPHIEDADHIPDEFDRYWQEQKVLALQRLCEEEGLDQQQFSRLIETYIFTGQEPLKEDVFKCLGDRPSVLKAREIGERVIERMREFVEVFEWEMAA
jgi:type I restriction enzyme, R subunit